MSLQEVYGHLLTYELRLEQQHATMDLANAFANIVSCTNNALSHANATDNQNSQNQNNCYWGRGHGRCNSSSNGSKPICHVCHRHGQTALKCYHQFDSLIMPTRPILIKKQYDPSWYPNIALCTISWLILIIWKCMLRIIWAQILFV